MNKELLRSIMVLHGDTGRSLSGFLGITEQTFSVKMNEKDGNEFNKTEISKIKSRYALTPEQLVSIFFRD